MIRHELFLIGDDAVAIRPEDRDIRHPLAGALRQSGEWIDVVPGKNVVAARFDPIYLLPSEALQKITAWLRDFQPEETPTRDVIDLHLDISEKAAPDLAAIAGANGLSPFAFLDRILKSDLKVDMLGFTPGFAYVEGVDLSLKSERLATPRQRVRAGSVGMVSGQLGLYGLAGPGGWPIIGRLTETLFDPMRGEPFLLTEGQTIRLHLVGD